MPDVVRFSLFKQRAQRHFQPNVPAVPAWFPGERILDFQSIELRHRLQPKARAVVCTLLLARSSNSGCFAAIFLARRMASASAAVARRSKVVTSAVVLVPPVSAWPAIQVCGARAHVARPCVTPALCAQAIRQQHDRAYMRWLPHVNLLYPFRPAEVPILLPPTLLSCLSALSFLSSHTQPCWLLQMLEAELPALLAAVANVAPFTVSLDDFSSFDHGVRSSLFSILPPVNN